MIARIGRRAPDTTATFAPSNELLTNSSISLRLSNRQSSPNRRPHRCHDGRTIRSSCCKVLGPRTKVIDLMPDPTPASRNPIWPYLAAALISLVGLGDAIYLTIQDLTGQNLRC